MGVANFRRSVISLHSELQAFIWAMKCMIDEQKRETAFLTECSELVKIMSSLTEWPSL